MLGKILLSGIKAENLTSSKRESKLFMQSVQYLYPGVSMQCIMQYIMQHVAMREFRCPFKSRLIAVCLVPINKLSISKSLWLLLSNDEPSIPKPIRQIALETWPCEMNALVPF